MSSPSFLRFQLKGATATACPWDGFSTDQRILSDCRCQMAICTDGGIYGKQGHCDLRAAVHSLPTGSRSPGSLSDLTRTALILAYKVSLIMSSE